MDLDPGAILDSVFHMGRGGTLTAFDRVATRMGIGAAEAAIWWQIRS